jgi:hypothetical protein
MLGVVHQGLGVVLRHRLLCTLHPTSAPSLASRTSCSLQLNRSLQPRIALVPWAAAFLQHSTRLSHPVPRRPAQAERLKDFLEDSARWEASAAERAAAAAASAPAADPQQLLLAEQARCADLEVQCRALASELLRSQHLAVELGKGYLPLLLGVEERLVDLCRADAA